MAARQRPEAGSDTGLSMQRVVVEAIRMADREGVDGLSMRRLAGVLGAGAMSLYHYVSSKEELLDAMIDVVYDEIELPPDDTDWQSAMRRRALSARGVLTQHPWAISLMESRTAPGAANLRHHDAVGACLRRAGFSVMMATRAHWMLDSYVYGSALQDASLPFATADELAGMAEDVYLPQIDAEEYPHLHEAAMALVTAGHDPEQQFIFGLDIILAGLEPYKTAE